MGLSHIDITRYTCTPDVPNSLPITGLLSKRSMRCSTVDNLPKPKLASFPSHLTEKCLTEFLGLCEVCVCMCVCVCVCVCVCDGVCDGVMV